MAEVTVNDLGSDLVEIALCFSILSAMVIGILAIGQMLYTYNFLSDMAREATRYAIVRGSTCTVTGCPATAATIQSYVRGLDYPGIVASNVTVATTWTPNNSPGNTVQVTVTYAFPLSVPWVTKQTFTMSSQSVMVISQ